MSEASSPKVLFVGTCRVQDPAIRVGGWVTGHRVFTPRELHQLARHLSGEAVFNADNLHLFSEAAIQALTEGRPEDIFASLERARRYWRDADAIVFEVSTFSSWWLGDALANTYAHQGLPKLGISTEDLRCVRDTPEVAVEELRHLRRLTDKSVLWVPHFNDKSDKPELEKLRSQRAQVTEVVRQVATEFGDRLFDATDLIDQLGSGFALAEQGADLNHFSREALPLVGRAYLDALA